MELTELCANSASVVVAYSGGLDSYICRYWLQSKGCKDTVYVYFDLNSRYTETELVYIKRQSNIIIDSSLSFLGQYEQGKFAFVPGRNLFIAMTLALKYRDIVVICGLKDDQVEDKNEDVFRQWSTMLSTLFRRPIKVVSPFWKYDKLDVVKNFYLDIGGSLDSLYRDTFSCYNPTGYQPCLSCPACFRKYVVFRCYGYNCIFRNKELAYEYYQRAKNGGFTPKRRESILKVVQQDFGFK